MDVVEPDEANETMEDLTDEQLEDVAGGSTNYGEIKWCEG